MHRFHGCTHYPQTAGWLSRRWAVWFKPNAPAHLRLWPPAWRPLSQISKLSIPTGIKEEGFEYRWILDKVERIEAFEAAWWEQVKDGTGRPIQKASGENGYLLLYKIPFKYYEEDVKEKQKLPINLLTEKAKLAKGNKYSNEYIPEGQEGVVVINH